VVDAWADRLKAIQGDEPEPEEDDAEWQDRLKAIQLEIAVPEEAEDLDPEWYAGYRAAMSKLPQSDPEDDERTRRVERAEQSFAAAAKNSRVAAKKKAEPKPPGTYVTNTSKYPISILGGSTYSQQIVIPPGESMRADSYVKDLDGYVGSQIKGLADKGMVTVEVLSSPPPSAQPDFKEYDLVALGPDGTLIKLGPDDLSKQAVGMVVDQNKTSGGAMPIVVTTLRDGKGRPVQVAVSGRYFDVEVSAAVMAGDQFWRSYLFKKQSGK